MNVNGNGATNKVATTNNNGNGQKSLRQWVASMADQIKCALPQNITPDRMMRIAMTAISKDTKLASCTPESFMGALLTSAQLGLECNTPLGQAYLIPFWNSKKQCQETQFQLGYQGILDLCYRTGQYKTIQARIVYEGDDFEYSYGLEEKLIHVPQGKTEKPIYVYAYYQLINGAKAYEVMSWDAVMAHAKKYSQSVQKGYTSPWSTDPESMAKKTCLKRLLKYAPKTVEIAEGIAGDTAVINTQVIKEDQNVNVIKDFDYSFDKESATDAETVKPETIPQNEPVQEPPKQDKKNVVQNNVQQQTFDGMQDMELTPNEESMADAAFEGYSGKTELGTDIF